MTRFWKLLFVFGVLAVMAALGPACSRKDAPRFPTPRLTFNLTRIPSPTPSPMITQGNWVRVADVVGQVHVIVITSDSGSGSTTFAGTSEGVLRSADIGDAWTAMNEGLTETDVHGLAVSPAYSSDNTVFAGTPAGIFRSTDGGGSWTAVNEGLTNMGVVDLLISPNFAADSTIFAGTARGLFRSTDAGDTWTEIHGTFNIEALAISPDYANDKTLYVGDVKEGVNRSQDGGETWQGVNSTGGSGRAVAEIRDKSIRSLGISPDFANDHTMFLGSRQGVSRSLERGDFWTNINAGIEENFHKALSIAFAPQFVTNGSVFVGTENLVYGSSARGLDWHLTGQGLPGTEITALAVSPTYDTDFILLAGTDGGIYRRKP